MLGSITNTENISTRTTNKFHVPKTELSKPMKAYIKLAPRIDPKPEHTLDQEREMIIKDPQKFSSEIQRIQGLIKNYKLLPHKNRWKIDLCLNGKECNYSDECKFAHSLTTLYAIKLMQYPEYKKNLCKTTRSAKAYCPYGIRCRDVHEGDLMQDKDSWAIYTKKYKKAPQQKIERKYVENLLREATIAYQIDSLKNEWQLRSI